MSEWDRPYFPMFVNLESKQIAVFGAGNVALRRILTLLPFHTSILVMASEIRAETRTKMEHLIHTNQVRFVQKEFEEADLTEDIDIVIAATDDHGLNEAIYYLCKEQGIMVNVATNPQLCDFYFPAVAIGDSVIAGVTGNGHNHKEVAEVAAEIRAYLGSRDEKKAEQSNDEDHIPLP